MKTYTYASAITVATLTLSAGCMPGGGGGLL